jgi:hypothetical protein
MNNWKISLAPLEAHFSRESVMTDYQQERLNQLQSKLQSLRGITTPLPVWAEQNGYVLTQVQGVTVVVIKRASPKPFRGFILPSVMTYKETGQRPNTSLDHAVWANERFAAQSGAAVRQKGPLGPIVDVNWRCANASCPCQNKGSAELARRNGVALQ